MLQHTPMLWDTAHITTLHIPIELSRSPNLAQPLSELGLHI